MAQPSGVVLCLGEALIDLIGDPAAPAAETERYLPRVGGAPANVAVGLARLGVAAAFVGVIGNDTFADLIVQRLTDEGVLTQYIKEDLILLSQTRLAIVTGAPKRREFAFYSEWSADTRLTPEMVRAAFERDIAAIYLSSLPLAKQPSRSALLEAVRLAKERRIPICFDPNPRWRYVLQPYEDLVNLDLYQQWPREEILEIAATADLLKLSLADLHALDLRLPEMLEMANRAHLLVLSDGENGCDYWLDGVRAHQPAFQVAAKDETGAGDAFTSALIARGVEAGFRYSATDLAFASAAGALATTGIGAMDALPRREQVETLMKKGFISNS